MTIHAYGAVLCRKDKNIRSKSKTVKDLSEEKRKIKLVIEATTDKIKREDLKRERNKYKGDSNRMFQVIRQLQP